MTAWRRARGWSGFGARGRERAARFTWTATAEATVDAYREVLGR